MIRKAQLVAAGAIVLVGGGCGGSSQQAAVDPGCTAAEPRGAEINPPAWGTLVRMCESTDGTGAHVDNLSSVVIDVSNSDLLADMSLEDHEATSPVAQAVQTAVPGSCDFSATCVLPAGRTLDISSDTQYSLHFNVDGTQTVVAHSAAALARWMMSKVTPSTGLVGQVVSCAQTANDLAEPEQWQEDVRSSIVTSQSCGQLVRSVLGEQADESAVGDRVTSMAAHVDEGLWVDELSYNAARILSHVH